MTPYPQGNTTAIAGVTVRILDVNDQTPTFELSSYEATIQENTQALVPVSLIPAGREMMVTDMDEVAFMCKTNTAYDSMGRFSFLFFFQEL